ncbi:CLOCK-interacting pacemaker [Etheostoma cragini]|uniref:CLOCK-interacting pacemaker n=1 Tax=Etheostoma cragini TaxID=417921 RepID=UPI00155E64C6|nr:CLOCK-interacting pacemaker [Etheostoma cragini]XP_034723429.1 CLOCK-interacting pacemaker [Etheostoma cragini]
MQKEQPCLRESSPCATSSKNAKNKTNNMILLAIRGTKDPDDSRGTGSRCSSEKDSGYSDGSDWHQTDAEDQQSSKSQSRGSGHSETSQPVQNKDIGQGNPGNPTLMPSGRKFAPIYITNSMVLKQPNIIQKRGQLLWRNENRETSSSSAAHMILFQQPSLLPATLQHQKPLSQMSNVTGKKINGTYLPTLNSYPRIAPHPNKKPLDTFSWNDKSQNLSKRVCTEHKSDGTPVTRSLPEQHLYKQPKLAVLTSELPCSSSTRDTQLSCPTTVPSSHSSPSGSGLYTTSSILTTRDLPRNSTTSTRHRRFFNTVEILRQSGLLDVTLRTQELLCQSNVMERNIAQLRQHTELLYQAASNPIGSLSGITAWQHLHQAMAESGSYPSLKILQNVQLLCHPDSASQLVPPSRLLTTLPDTNAEQGRELKGEYKSSDNVTFMPPDSSTG